MTAAQAAQRHLAELADGGVSPRDKPSAFHHGLLTALVAENEQLAITVEEGAASVERLQEYVNEYASEAAETALKLSRIVALVNEQAEDEGLWGTHIPPSRQPIVEAYLQQALRKLHRVIEEKIE